MIYYRYNRQVVPPAPFVYVSIQAPVGERAMAECPAQLDPAADLTVIPSRLVKELQLDQLGELPILGVGAHLEILPTFLVQIGIREKPAHLIKVLASPEEPYVLLGRDVLNHFRITFDGPNLMLEIE
jgi:Retroviral aspartyl protease